MVHKQSIAASNDSGASKACIRTEKSGDWRMSDSGISFVQESMALIKSGSWAAAATNGQILKPVFLGVRIPEDEP